MSIWLLSYLYSEYGKESKRALFHCQIMNRTTNITLANYGIGFSIKTSHIFFLLILFLLFGTTRALSFELTDGNIYTSSNWSMTVRQHTIDGTYVDSYTVPPNIGSEVRGLAFGPDGLLYMVLVADMDFVVVAIDSDGIINSTYTGSGYISGNLSYGKIAFGEDDQFFVAGTNNLISFTIGSPLGTVVFTTNQVFDVEFLPTGTLLVLSAYEIHEITKTGDILRTINPSISLTDARGIEYNPLTNDIFVNMLGHSGNFLQLMKIDANTGLVLKQITFNYGDDMFLTSDSKLIVGSRSELPTIFDLNLNQIGTLPNEQRMFVTQKPFSPDILFKDGFE